MGIVLRSAAGSEHLTHVSWYQLLRLSRQYGGHVEGLDGLRSRLMGAAPGPGNSRLLLERKPVQDERKNYHRMSRVVAEDLAATLTRALDELPAEPLLGVYEEVITLMNGIDATDSERREMAEQFTNVRITDAGAMVVSGLPFLVSIEAEPAHYWSGKAERIRELITFFEAGSFMIG